MLTLALAITGAWAQRQTDALDRGLIAMKKSGGIYCSWRILAEEYYDVTYNIYRDGTKLNDEPLTVSNYTDASGTTSNTYTVEAVVRGEAQEQCEAVTPWSDNYMDITMDHGDLTSTYVPNDANFADVDGDGELEMLLKFDNNSDSDNGYMPEGYNGEYAIMEIYKLDGTKLWWIDLGPNMTDFQNNENNIIAYDWDQDGKAEAVMRAADGTVIHMADGTTQTIGDASKNYRDEDGSSGQFFIYQGDEYLLYLNGETGEPYQVLEYPLKRLEDGETDLDDAWGDGYGHRSTKHFFGAPVLDGRNASIFLARGIYTRHKMIAYDVDPDSHELTVRWRWNCSDSSSDWYGQGNHNYNVADVDWDGRDEIVYGSMVIDDNGNGLSTTGLGHGDAMHTGDFDPYNHGQEVFACLEENPGNNFRDATTSKIYYRFSTSDDDGRAIMGNFFDDIPGAEGTSASDDYFVSSVTHSRITDETKENVETNFRIYWDGDLCEESFNYRNGKNSEGHIVKAREGEIAILTGTLTNNDTKGTPCFQGDLFGDWREEVVMRTSNNNVRIYTTDEATDWRIYTLWHDFQYRQAMGWQMCGYNQPPHVSYFLGEMEGITTAPAPLTMTGRTEIADGSTISSSYDDEHIIMCETNDMTVAVSDGAQPYIFTDNAPTWVQGNDDNDNIVTTTYTHTLTGGAFTGDMRLVKQGDGVLVLPDVTETYTGETNVWAGTLQFDGTMQNSRVWLNRFTNLISDGGVFSQGIEADYKATIYPGGSDNKGTIETDSLILNFGSFVSFDLYGEDITADVIKANVLSIGTKDWDKGPDYLAPVFTFVKHIADGDDNIADGTYLIGEIGEIDGDINDLIIDGLASQKSSLSYEDGNLYLTIVSYAAGNVTWTGNEDATWDIDNTANFYDASSDADRSFVPGDSVVFDDTAAQTEITISGNVAPSLITFNNESVAYTFSGDSIAGDPEIIKNGAGRVTFNNTNHTGNTTINGGTVSVAALANEDGQDYGSLGAIDKTITLAGGTLDIAETSTSGQSIIIGEGNGTINIESGYSLTMAAPLLASGNKRVLTKDGSGSMTISTDNTISKIIIEGGSVTAAEDDDAVSALPDTVEIRSGTLYDTNTQNSYSANSTNFIVPEGSTGSFYVDPRCEYTGTLTGAGKFYVYAAGVRNYFYGDWSDFEGTLIPGLYARGSYDPSFDFCNSYGLGKATLQVDEDVTFKNNRYNVELGDLTGEGTISGTGTYTIGLLGNDISFKGTISASPVVKKGEGTWTLTTSTLFSSIGLVTISEGTLYLNTYNSSTVIMPNTTVTVKSGATVSGAGMLGKLTLNEGAEMTPGRTTSEEKYGFLGTDGRLTVDSGAVVNLNIISSNNTQLSRTYLTVGSTFSFNGTLNVTLSDSYEPADGDSIILWTANKFSGEPTVNLPDLPSGFSWDTSDLLATTGILRVVAGDTGIDEILASGVDLHCYVYTLGGVLVGEFDAPANTVTTTARSLGLSSGTYIIKGYSDSGPVNIKTVIK